MDNKKYIATLASIIAQVIFGFSFVFTKIALDYASPMTFVAGRYIIAFLGMTVIMLISGYKLKFRKSMWKIALMAFFQPVLYFVFETFGINLTTSAFSSVMISLVPVAAMVCGIFVLGEVPRFMQYVFSIVSVCGVSLMALSGKSDGTVTVAGIILLVGAVLSACAFNIASRKFSKEFSAFERTYATCFVGMISFVVIALFENISNPSAIITPFFNTPYVMAVLYLSIVSSIVAFFLLNYANTYLPVAKTTVFSNITTVVSVIAGMLILDEKITPVVATSVVMIIIGVTGVQLIGVKTKNKDNC